MRAIPCRTILILSLLLAIAPPARAAGEGLDSIMDRDPELPGPKVVTTVRDEWKSAWVEALARPEASYKIGAAQAIAEAHRRGMKGLETTVPNLVAELKRADPPADVTLAVAETLVVLDAKDAAPQLFVLLAAGGADLREIVEPALANWKHEPARAMWLDRLAQAPSRRGTVLAVRGLLVMNEEKAVPRLQELALAKTGIPVVRLEAATALAEFRRTGAEAFFKDLTADATSQGITSRLVAATLLRNHDGDEAIRLLQALAKDGEPTVAARALARLVELDPKHTAPVLDTALANTDPAVRLLAVAALGREPTPPNLKRLANRLEDEHPFVRTQARLTLTKLFAKADVKAVIVQETTRVLGGKNWGGLQQAALLAAAFDHKPAADRLVELCTHERSEVFVTAAWALRKLAVSKTDAAAFALFRSRTEFVKREKSLTARVAQAVDEQLGQFAQRLGEAKFRAADAAFRGLIPPKSGGTETRAAAVWALGKMYEGEKALGFESAVLARLNATGPYDVENPRVRQMCAVTLGRVGFQPAVDAMKGYCPASQPSPDVVNNACGWALERLTGQKYSAPGELTQRFSNFFLVPLDKP